MSWHDALAKKITVDEYYIHYRNMQFKVRYVVHNSYTVIEPLPEYNKSTDDFAEWFRLRIDMNTRYDLPHWYKPIKFNRDKKIVKWTLEAIEAAYGQYHQENINRNK